MQDNLKMGTEFEFYLTHSQKTLEDFKPWPYGLYYIFIQSFRFMSQEQIIEIDSEEQKLGDS